MADERTDAQLRASDLIGIGGLLAGAVIAGTLLGLLVDHLAGTSPVFVLVGVFLGIITGGVGFWLRIRPAIRGADSGPGSTPRG